MLIRGYVNKIYSKDVRLYLYWVIKWHLISHHINVGIFLRDKFGVSDDCNTDRTEITLYALLWANLKFLISLEKMFASVS